VNLVVRERSAEIDRLLDLGDELRSAMGGDASEVRRLTEERRSLIGELVDRELPAAVQSDVTATLEAATADPELGAAVRSGRLVKPLRYAGFGALPDLGDALATPVAANSRKTARKSAAKPAKQPAKHAAASKSGRPPAQKRTEEPPSPDLAAARAHVLELSGIADDAQRRYERAVNAAAEARHLLELAEKERAEAHKAANEAHRAAEKARRELGRLERS